MQLKGCSSIPQPKEPEEGGDGHLLHVSWVDRDLVVALPPINLGEGWQPAAFAAKSSILGSGSGSVTGHQVEVVEIAARMPVAMRLHLVEGAGPGRGRPLNNPILLLLRLGHPQLLAIKFSNLAATHFV